MYSFVATDWMWRVPGKGVWSTAAAAYVDDATWQAWLARTGQPFVPVCPADQAGAFTEQGLRESLRFYGLPLGDLAGPEERKAAILTRLAEIDAASVRPLRAIAKGEAAQADHNKLAALDAEADTLRAELAGLG